MSNSSSQTLFILRHLLKNLWQEYQQRVSYAQVYQQMILEAGGEVANDHIAFRSLRHSIQHSQETIHLGIDYLGKLFEAFGYEVAGELAFSEQQLFARYYQHPEQENFGLPKLFISELVLDNFPENISKEIIKTVEKNLEISLSPLELLQAEINRGIDTETIALTLQKLFTRPWHPPTKSVVESVNQVSQYGAWTLLHGYAVNHFTGYINRHHTSQYPDIETTAEALAKRGVPMKAEIEGSRGSGLRQTSTQAVIEKVPVWDEKNHQIIHIPWTYAYYEIAERNQIEITPGNWVLFAGFLDSQAKNLFKMTQLQSDSTG